MSVLNLCRNVRSQWVAFSQLVWPEESRQLTQAAIEQLDDELARRYARLLSRRRRIETLRDPVHVQTITERAYEEVACDPEWSYQSFVRQFDRVVDLEIIARSIQCTDNTSAIRITLDSKPLTIRGYIDNKVWSVCNQVMNRLLVVRWRLTKSRYNLVIAAYKLHPMKLLYSLWPKLPLSLRQLIRPIARRILLKQR